MNENKPLPTAYTTKEGGDWISWNDTIGRCRRDATIHAIRFDDGSIFDMVNGWRKKESPPKDGLWALEKVELAFRRAGCDALATHITDILRESR